MHVWLSQNYKLYTESVPKQPSKIIPVCPEAIMNMYDGL